MRTEEEQLEALKNWWNKNGNALLTGVVLALVIIGGYKFYNNHTIETASAASMKYQELVELSVSGSSKLDEKALADAVAVYETLKAEHGSSNYTQLAALLIAKQLVLAEDYEGALTYYQTVLSSKPSDDVAVIAKLRIAKIEYQLGQYDAALTTIASIKGDLMSASVHELKGDVLLAKEDVAGAKAAYEAAQTIATEQNLYMPNLKLKVDDLAVPASTEGA